MYTFVSLLFPPLQTRIFQEESKSERGFNVETKESPRARFGFIHFGLFISLTFFGLSVLLFLVYFIVL